MSVSQLVEVAFKGNRREFFLWPFEDAPALRTAVIVDADRGEDLGIVHATGDLARQRRAGTTHGKASGGQLRGILRAATATEIERAVQLRADEDNVRRRAIEKVRSQGLDMKVSDTEWQWDRKKLTVYFTAETRVDFRNLVRQLEGLFGTRVQMWHIGVRDEAKRLDGVGRCARQYCSASWLPELRPVKSSSAKDQRLSTLNPAQISGACGRLMCCLRYEHEFYVQQRKRFPKEGKIVTTRAGEEKIVANDIFREQVTLRNVEGDSRTITLLALKAELGGELLSTTAEHRSDMELTENEEEEQVERVLVELDRAPRRVMPAATPMTRAPGSAPENAAVKPAEGRGTRSTDGSVAKPAAGTPARENPRANPREKTRNNRRDIRREVTQEGRRPDSRPVSRPPGQPVVKPVVEAAPAVNERADSSEGAPVKAGEGRKRRRGRRGGRRGGREGGGPPGASGAPGGHTPGTPTTPSTPGS